MGRRPDTTDTEWQTTLDGRCVIDTIAGGLLACSRLIYAYWRISSQPITIAAKPPLDRPARRRAARASILHDTRVIMLRRTNPVGDPSDGEAKWHYRVPFVVKGHWRRLHDKDGQPYRIWINAYIKGPDGAPLLHGEKDRRPRPLTNPAASLAFHRRHAAPHKPRPHKRRRGPRTASAAPRLHNDAGRRPSPAMPSAQTRHRIPDHHRQPAAHPAGDTVPPPGGAGPARLSGSHRPEPASPVGAGHRPRGALDDTRPAAPAGWRL